MIRGRASRLWIKEFITMKTNKTLLKKKDFIQKMVSLPSITLEAEEADRFIDYIVDESVLMKQVARVVKMSRPTKNVRALGVGTDRFLHPASTFSSSNYLKQFTQNKIALTSKKVRGCVAIYDDDLEDVTGIESGVTFKDHIMKLVAAKIANELEEAFYIGDTDGHSGFGADDIRSLWDGWSYRIRNADDDTDPYYNAVSGGSTILHADSDFDLGSVNQRIATQNTSAPYNWEFKFSKPLKILPSKYKMAGLSNLRFCCNDQVVQDYVDALAARSTILGDQAILGAEKGIKFGQVPIVPCPLIPTTLDDDGKLGGGSHTEMLLTPKGNLIVGIQREIKIESQREAADEATYWFYSMRADVAVENVNACVLVVELDIA